MFANRLENLCITRKRLDRKRSFFIFKEITMSDLNNVYSITSIDLCISKIGLVERTTSQSPQKNDFEFWRVI